MAQKLGGRTPAPGTPTRAFEVGVRAVWTHPDWWLTSCRDGSTRCSVRKGACGLRGDQDRPPSPSRGGGVAPGPLPGNYSPNWPAYLALAEVLPEFQGKRPEGRLVLIDIDSGNPPIPSPSARKTARSLTVNSTGCCPFSKTAGAGARGATAHDWEIRPAFAQLPAPAQGRTFRNPRAQRPSGRAPSCSKPPPIRKTRIVLEHALSGGCGRDCSNAASTHQQVEPGQLEGRSASLGMVARASATSNAQTGPNTRIDSPGPPLTGDARCDE